MTSTKFRSRKYRRTCADGGAAAWRHNPEVAEAERRAHPEWESGGGGLVSTPTDYARFAQMILNGGEFGGKRYLSAQAFKSMTTDHIGPGSGVARDYFYFPGDGFGFGYGFAVRTEPGNASRRRQVQSVNSSGTR